MTTTTKFTDKIAETIVALAESGLTDAEIGAELSLDVQTLRNWRGKYPDFREAVKNAKAIADELVEVSLFKRATGYRHKATKIFYDSKLGKIVREDYEEVYPPDTTAAIFWLKNRQKERWRDVWHIKVEQQPELPTTPEAMKILSEDFAMLPATDVKVEDL